MRLSKQFVHILRYEKKIECFNLYRLADFSALGAFFLLTVSDCFTLQRVLYTTTHPVFIVIRSAWPKRGTGGALGDPIGKTHIHTKGPPAVFDQSASK